MQTQIIKQKQGLYHSLKYYSCQNCKAVIFIGDKKCQNCNTEIEWEKDNVRQN